MRMRRAIVGIAVLLMAARLGAVRADEIALWNSMGVVEPRAGTFAPSSTHANVTVSNLITSPTLLLSGSGPATNTFAAAGYSAASSNAAMTSNHYWQTVIRPASGYSVTYTNIRYRFRAPASGPKSAQWAYSLNGSTFTWLMPSNPVLNDYADDRDISLTGVAALNSATGTVWFRMYAWGGQGGSTAWGVFGRTNVLIFSGTVGSTGPVLPTVSFNPSGSQSVAVSNTLNLTVSITPAGSGMQSWSLVPAYSGPAGLTGGNFTFTPASGDSGKTFTLSVVGTNNVGSTTGTVSISVTPYEAPVPVVTFSPTGTYSIMATTTQKLGVGVAPAGSGISGWSLVPSNYSGTATLVGTNFTFVTAQGDGPSNYTLSVVATNVFGARTGTAEIAVTAFVPAPPPGAYFTDFETSTNGTYGEASVNLNGQMWTFNQTYIGTLDGDRKFGERSARIRYMSGFVSGITSQGKLWTNGIGTISLWYGSYGGDGENSPVVAIEVSEYLASNWIEVASFDTSESTNLTYLAKDLLVSTPVYVRLRAKSGGESGRGNVDNLTITGYAAAAAGSYNAYLLQYNVTPGDPGTAEGDDYDGDESTNLQEYNAVPKTNPYDPASHP